MGLSIDDLKYALGKLMDTFESYAEEGDEERYRKTYLIKGDMRESLVRVDMGLAAAMGVTMETVLEANIHNLIVAIKEIETRQNENRHEIP
jgi:hypothetical protein